MTEVVLQDQTKTGRDRPWGVHKMANELLAVAYDEVDLRKADRLRNCATRLTFEKKEDGKLKLAGTHFCRVRLCPVCTWRRSLKAAAQMHTIMSAIKADKPMSYILLTLTQRNCFPEQLGDEITKILAAFNNLTKRVEFSAAVKGYYRAMEVTHNLDEDTYHPHLHVILAVNPSYFKSRDYVSHDDWVRLWREALKIDYDPNVDVRRVKGDTAKAVAEVAKYAVKSGDYIIPDDWDMTVSTVRLLNSVLDNRRFISFGGLFKDYHKKLHLDDADQGDLIHTDPNDKPNINGKRVVHFAWFSGYRQYRQE